jgi:hypothetical protein
MLVYPYLTTDELGDLYGIWCLENGLDDSLPADDLLFSYAQSLTYHQRKWINDFITIYKEAEARESTI